MLNVMRRSATSWIVKLLLFLLAMSFGVWGVGDYIQRQQNEPVAEVENYGISPVEFANAYDRDYNRLRQASGGAIDKKAAEAFGLKQQTLQRLIERHLISMTGHELRMRAPPERIRASIANNPAFVRDGRFDMEQYNIVLRNNRLSPQEYERQLASDLALEQIERALRTVVEVPRPVVEILYRMFREKRSVSYLALNRDAIAREIKPTDETLEAYLKEHAQAFKTPAMVKLHYVVLDADSVRDGIKVTPEELKEFYEEHQSDYQKEESRRVRHILVRVPEGKEGEAAALARIQAAAQRLTKGEDFAHVARELSEDPTASEGGDLGFFGRGAMVLPFEEAAFALAPGQLSQPVRTDFGYHLIRVEEVRPPETKTLQEVTLELTARLITRKAQDAVYDRSASLEDQLFASGDLQTIAKDYNLRYRETDFIARDSEKLTGVERNPKFMDAAFTTTPGENSPLLEVGESTFAALQVVETREPREQTLAEAREAVQKAYVADEANKRARQLMDESLKALQGGAAWESLAKGHIKLDKTPAFSLSDTDAKIPAPVRDAAFNLTTENPLGQKVLEEGGTFYLAKLLTIEEAPAEGLEKDGESIARQVEKGLAAEQVGEFLQDLTRTSRIVIHQKSLDKF